MRFSCYNRNTLAHLPGASGVLETVVSDLLRDRSAVSGISTRNPNGAWSGQSQPALPFALRELIAAVAEESSVAYCQTKC